MIPTTLQQDLVRDFQEQKKSVAEQVTLIDPMATSLRQPAARRLINAGFLILGEILCWLLVIAGLTFVFFMDKLYPFYLITQLEHDSLRPQQYHLRDLNALEWTLRGAGIILALLFFILTRTIAAIRVKNSVLNVAGKNMKLLAEQLLKRKAAMQSLQERYPVDLPSNDDTIIIPGQQPHNDTLL
ncbi:MAG: hypothetical protein QM642_05180 [Edaphocola sp.]